jgi:hypothetical protein
MQKKLFWRIASMDLPFDFVKAYDWHNKQFADLEKTTTDVLFGLYNPGTGEWGEMAKARWTRNMGWSEVKFKLDYDAFRMLRHFPELLRLLDQTPAQDVAPDRFVFILLQCGFADTTRYPSCKDVDQTRQQLQTLKKQADKLCDLLGSCLR